MPRPLLFAALLAFCACGHSIHRTDAGALDDAGNASPDSGAPDDGGPGVDASTPCDASLCVVVIDDQHDAGNGQATGLLENRGAPESPDYFTVLLDVSTGTAQSRAHRRTVFVGADVEVSTGYVWAISGSTEDFWIIGDKVDHFVAGTPQLTPCGTAVFWTGVDVEDAGTLLTGNFGNFSLVCAGTSGVIASSNDGSQWTDAARLRDGGLYVVTQFGAIERDGQLVHQLQGTASLSSTFLLRQREDQVWAASCTDATGAVAIIFPDGGVSEFDAGTCVGAMLLEGPDDAWLASGVADGGLVHLRSDGTFESIAGAVPMATSSLLLTDRSLFAAGTSGSGPRVVQYHLRGQ
jgi:hypothetical protein